LAKCYITLNVHEGWKVVLDGKVVDSTKPVFDSGDTTINGLEKCREFCNENHLNVIRECQ
jgi:hypothetical protein